MEWALAGEPLVAARGCLREPREMAENKLIIWMYRGDSCVVTPYIHLGTWGKLLLRVADASRQGRATSIHLRDWDLAPTRAKLLGKKQHAGSCCSIAANAKLLPLWHEACWKGFVYNCVKLFQANHSGLNFCYYRVEGHRQRRRNGEACRKAPLRDMLHMPFLLRSAQGAGWNLAIEVILFQLTLRCSWNATSRHLFSKRNWRKPVEGNAVVKVMVQ